MKRKRERAKNAHTDEIFDALNTHTHTLAKAFFVRLIIIIESTLLFMLALHGTH